MNDVAAPLREGMARMHQTITQAGPAVPELVWRRYVDLDAWSQWAPFITGVEATGRELVGGLTGTVLGVGGLRVPFTVLGVDDASRSWTWRVRVARAPVTMRHDVVPESAGGTRAALALDGAAALVLGYLLPARLALRSLVHP